MMVIGGGENRLGAFLRARRERVTPEQVGIPAGTNRRVPGLRREEVALLAGISADYYLRLERGRDRNPSPQVLDALARVLLLGDVERDHLFGLVAARPQPRRRRRAEHVPERLEHLLAALQVPAFIEGRAFDVLASNQLAVAFSPRLRPGENRLRSLLLDPEEREFHVDWDAATAGYVAAFRRSIGDESDDDRLVELVAELSRTSERFRSLWERHDIGRLEGGTTTVNHPIVGPIRLHRDKLPVGDLILVAYYPDAGSDDAEKLDMLASVASTTHSGRSLAVSQPNVPSDPVANTHLEP